MAQARKILSARAAVQQPPPPPAPQPQPQPLQIAQSAGDDDQGTDQSGGAPIVALTHPGDNTPVFVDPLTITHVQSARGQVAHRDPKKAAGGDTELGFVTELGTIGGLAIRVLEDVESVAKAIGWL